MRPSIFIDPIGTGEAGSKFTITGTTNAAVGDKLIVDVTSAAFDRPRRPRLPASEYPQATVVVEKGDGANKWSFELDARLILRSSGPAASSKAKRVSRPVSPQPR